MAIFELLVGRKARPPQILFGGTTIVMLQLDVAINEEHIYENRIPQYPIDSANTISDHIWTTPDRLNIEGQVTNAPVQAWYIPGSSNNTTEIGGQNANRVLTAYEVLLALSGRKLLRNSEDNAGQGTIQRPTVIDIITSTRIFNNMVIESLRVPKNASVWDEFMFNVQFVEVTRSTVHDTNINYVNDKIYGADGVGDQSAGTTNAGVQPNTETGEPNNTILKNIIDGGKSLLDKYGQTIKDVTLGTGG